MSQAITIPTITTPSKPKNNFKNVKEHQRIILGTIYAASYGYSMELVDFYQVVRRSGNTIYTRRIRQKRTPDPNWPNAGTATAIKDAFDSTEEFRSHIKDEEWAKINGKYARVWNGDSIWYNHND